MMKVELIHTTLVRLEKGTVLEVPEAEARRLMAFKNAVEYVEKKQKKGAAK